MTATNAPASVARPKRTTWRRVAIVLICLAVGGVGLLEIGLRIFLGLGNPVIYQADAACGYLPVPNQHVRRFGCVNDINAFSQRSVDLPAEKQPGHYRVLFLGDSVTFGTTHVDQSQIFTARLARDLPRQLSRPVDVMNAATGAWAVGNELGYLQSRGTFGADVVIFVINTGDLVQPFCNMTFGETTGYPDRRPLTAIGELWMRYARPRLFAAPAAVDAGSTAATRNDIATPVVLDKLDQARTFATRAGARFALVYSPACGPDWSTPSLRDDFAQLQGWTAAHYVPLLDLTAAYAADTPAHVYLDEIHLRPRGNELAANAMEAYWLALTGERPASRPVMGTDQDRP